MNPATDKSEAAILDRVFRPNAADWPRAAADAILNIGFDPSDRARMAQLVEMAKDGDLSREQAEELEHYRHIGRLLELMKSRARRSLQSTPPDKLHDPSRPRTGNRSHRPCARTLRVLSFP